VTRSKPTDPFVTPPALTESGGTVAGPGDADAAAPSQSPQNAKATHGAAGHAAHDYAGKRPFWDSDGVPAWLTSLVVHTAILILLTLWTLPPKGDSGVLIVARTGPPTVETQPLVRLELPKDPADARPADAASPTDLIDAQIEVSSQRAPADQLDPITADFPPISTADPAQAAAEEAERRMQTSRELAAMLANVSAQGSPDAAVRLPTGGFAPRNPSTRAELGKLYGATPESENAVELALAWLAEHQQANGSWSFDLKADPCRGRCSHSRIAGDAATPPTAATGLSLLAFLGAGYTHREGKYAEVVRRGIYYLRDEARPAQFGFDLQAGSMYGHGIATLALAEVQAIDRYNNQEEADLRELVEGAILFTLVAQHNQGGWRYVPGSPGDMTVSGWQILSLVSARYGGIKLRTNTMHDAKRFIKSLSHEGTYEFGYQSTRPQPTTTAIGLCMLMYLGDSPFHTPYLHALSKMAERGPKKFDLYHDYYATMALHNARHPDWELWHKPLRDHLVRTQATTGHEKGSWHFKDTHGDVGGRLYSTAMAAMILEVYYRYLPLYQNRDAF
jgi:hypothetical protein